jgi:hypothetical protein
MPEEHWLGFMAEMFANDPHTARDRFTTSIFALLMCAPSRISEIQDLPANCLYKENDSHGKERLGLRFYGRKGFGADIKYVIDAFKDIATDAVQRLTMLSAEGRKLGRVNTNS